MNFKLKCIIGALVALLVVVVTINVIPMIGQDQGDKVIHVILKDGEEIIYDEEIRTDAALLSDVLKEMKEDKEIKLTYTDSAFGMFITEMGVSKTLANDDATQTYWTFDSKNNKQCKEASFCDAADKLKVNDKDKFVFSYSKYE